jgi:hypothetical protein
MSIDGVDVMWSDNYFDLPAGASASNGHASLSLNPTEAR